MKDVEKLLEALEPFARAGRRVVHYEAPGDDVLVVAVDDEGCEHQLHAADSQLDSSGEDRLLCVRDLKEALAAYVAVAGALE